MWHDQYAWMRLPQIGRATQPAHLAVATSGHLCRLVKPCEASPAGVRGHAGSSLNPAPPRSPTAALTGGQGHAAGRGRRALGGAQLKLRLLQLRLAARQGGFQAGHLALGLAEADHDALALPLRHGLLLLQVLRAPTLYIALRKALCFGLSYNTLNSHARGVALCRSRRPAVRLRSQQLVEPRPRLLHAA